MKTFFKFLQRNKLYTAIEVFGLSVALGFVVLLASYARTEYSVGRTRPAYDSIYAVGYGERIGMTLGTGEKILNQLPAFTSWTRISCLLGAHVLVGDEYHQVQAVGADADFFQFMQMPLLAGDQARALRDRESVVLTESCARRLFGTSDAIGKSLTWQRGGEKVRLHVTGVMPDLGPSSIFQDIDMVVPMLYLQGYVAEMDNFGSVFTFTRLAAGTSAEKAQKDLLQGYKDYWQDWPDNGDNGSFLWGASLVPVSGIYFAPIERDNGVLRKGDRSRVLTLVGVALMLLLSALFNYVNLTVAQTGRRAREMATRRLVGETRMSVLRRFIAESFLFTGFCFLLGCLVAFAFRPLFNEWLDTSIVFPTDSVSLLVALAALVLVSLLSAFMPALLVLRIKPIDVMKGNFRFRSKMVLGRVFMVLQSAISMVLVSVGLCMVIQMQHMLHRPTGYRTEGILMVNTWALGTDRAQQELLHNRLVQLPQVRRAGYAGNVPWAVGYDGVHRDGEKLSWMRRIRLDSTVFDMLGFKVIEQYTKPLPGQLLVTRETCRRYRISPQNPYVEPEHEGRIRKRVCGLVSDYYAGSAVDEPMKDSHNVVELIGEKDSVLFCQVIEVQGNEAEAMNAVKEAYRQTALELSGLPVEAKAYYVTDYLKDELKGTRNTMMLVLVFMFISVMISALGLLAMSVYFTAQQSRQIALRRVFGYGQRAVVGWLSVRFVLTTLVAVVLATPLSIWLMLRYLQGFHYAISFPWYILPLSALIILLVAMLSILWQTWRAASCNPSKTLRSNE